MQFFWWIKVDSKIDILGISFIKLDLLISNNDHLP